MPEASLSLHLAQITTIYLENQSAKTVLSDDDDQSGVAQTSNLGFGGEEGQMRQASILASGEGGNLQMGAGSVLELLSGLMQPVLGGKVTSRHVLRTKG